jgi:hypothetical protein
MKWSAFKEFEVYLVSVLSWELCGYWTLYGTGLTILNKLRQRYQIYESWSFVYTLWFSLLHKIKVLKTENIHSS